MTHHIAPSPGRLPARSVARPAFRRGPGTAGIALPALGATAAMVALSLAAMPVRAADDPGRAPRLERTQRAERPASAPLDLQLRPALPHGPVAMPAASAASGAGAAALVREREQERAREQEQSRERGADRERPRIGAAYGTGYEARRAAGGAMAPAGRGSSGGTSGGGGGRGGR